jgi:hypothetical protein
MSDAGERAIVRQYQAQFLELRARAATSVGALWQTYGGFDDLDIVSFAPSAAEAVRTAQIGAVNLIDGYFDALAREAGFPELANAPRLDPTRHIGAAVRNGADPLDVYSRPAITGRNAMAKGDSWQQAMDKAERRAITTAETDVALTNRSAAQEAMENRGVRFYRRTLTGRSCVFCATASTQRYRTGELMPLHPRCDCGVAPIFGDRDPGQVLNRDLLQEIKRGDVPSYWDQKGFVEETDEGFVFEIGGKRTILRTNTVTHGELGPTLVNARHNPTTPAQIARGTGTKAEAPPTPARRGRVPTVDDVDVRREAARKQISPQQVLAQREKKRLDRLEEQKLARDAVKEFTVDNPKVRAVAEEFGITPDDLVAGRLQLEELRRQVREAAKESQAQAFAELYRLNDYKIRGPLKTDKKGGLYDWLEGLDQREKARLSRGFFEKGSRLAPDQLADIMATVGYRVESVDDAMEIWLDITRRYEAAGALARGKLPSARAYSGAAAADANVIATKIAAEGYDVYRILDPDIIRAAAHVVAKQADEIADEALSYLGNATQARYGPRPYQMRYQSWRDEVEDLEFLFRNRVTDMTLEELGRYAELVPDAIDTPGISYQELYARIIDTARSAKERVIDDVDIPWSS